MTATAFAEGDKVQIVADADPKWAGQVGTVTKVNRTTLDLVLGSGARLRTEPYMLKAYDGEVTPPSALPGHLPCGTVVRFTDPRGAARFPGLHVVIRDSGDKTKVAPLGGDHDHYVNAPRGSISEVDVAAILKDGAA